MQFLDITAHNRPLERRVLSAWKNILGSGSFIGGKTVEKFEKNFARFCGVQHAISVNSGTDALFLGLKSLGIGSGDEVITTPFTFIATVGAIINTGARPVFCDIQPDAYTINSCQIEKYITKKTRAILPVHLYGELADMEIINRIAQKHRLFVVEDAAQSAGAQYKKKKAGSFGDIGCFSFFPSKNLGGCGDGGMITTHNARIAARIHLLKNHGSSKKEKYRNLLIGTNSRLDAIQAAYLDINLPLLSRYNQERIRRARFYSRALTHIVDIRTPHVPSDDSHVFHTYTIAVREPRLRPALIAHLRKRNIPTMIYYPLPLHLQPALKYLGYRRGDFPHAEQASKSVLSLPIYPELSHADQKAVIKALTNFFKTCYDCATYGTTQTKRN